MSCLQCLVILRAIIYYAFLHDLLLRRIFAFFPAVWFCALLFLHYTTLHTVADLENFGVGGMQKFKRHEDTTQNTDVDKSIYLCFKLGVETPLILDSGLQCYLHQVMHSVLNGDR